MKILCRTLFDCTYTGITGNFKITQLPFTDQAGQTIANHREWTQARNQQRNWETLLQIISLRAQPNIVEYPTKDQDSWRFVFEVETAGVYSGNGQVNDFGTLLNECNDIPMIVGLTESTDLVHQLVSQGDQQNIWFETVNKSLEHTDG